MPVTGSALGYVPLLKSIAEHSYRTAPYAIADEVFWIRAGCWHRFPIELQGEKVTAEPPPEFLEILDSIEDDEPQVPPE
jgi:hypothetical protein